MDYKTIQQLRQTNRPLAYWNKNGSFVRLSVQEIISYLRKEYGNN